MADGLDDVTCSRLAFGADHRRAFADAAERLAEILRTADERNLELRLVNVQTVIGWGEHFAFVDVVDLDRLKNLGFGEMPDAALGHDGDRDGGLNALDHLRVAHARDAARCADVGWDALERHDGTGSGRLGDPRLLGGGDIHDDAAFEHLGEVLV